MPKSITDHWTFGQVEIPGNLNGSVKIVGNSEGDSVPVAIDDLNFIETSCPQVTIQTLGILEMHLSDFFVYILSVAIKGEKSKYSSLSIDDIVYTKYRCKMIPSK
ncbi:hypothetical protein AC249_AIPGENE29075 [Exaiptasia diaphana]|nr:hypothetical protein AC249_AIPGENE29075 [Exaiptasia diaphana]